MPGTVCLVSWEASLLPPPSSVTQSLNSAFKSTAFRRLFQPLLILEIVCVTDWCFFHWRYVCFLVFSVIGSVCCQAPPSTFCRGRYRNFVDWLIDTSHQDGIVTWPKPDGLFNASAGTKYTQEIQLRPTKRSRARAFGTGARYYAWKSYSWAKNFSFIEKHWVAMFTSADA